jgi:YfiH family protein
MTLRHALLGECGVAHGFGLRTTPAPRGLVRPRQVHGCRVVAVRACREQPAPEADGVVSDEPGVPVGVVTADCLPILLASRSGRAVSALHAGWRGLAGGIVAVGVEALRERAGAEELVAVVGPHIRACCYEVDAPVVEALRLQFGRDVKRALRPTRPGHAYLDLGALATRALERAGVDRARVGNIPDACTRCDPERFHSYRRDGERAGRLVHFVAAAQGLTAASVRV